MNAVMPLPSQTNQDALSYVGPIVVGDAKEKGRGVFATAFIQKGELIERAPVVAVPEKFKAAIDGTNVYNYYYAWGATDDDLAIALGLGSIYNHSYTPNAVFDRRVDANVVDFIALRDIQPGEEITTNYNGEPDDQEEIDFFQVK